MRENPERTMPAWRRLLLSALLVLLVAAFRSAQAADESQYAFGDLRVAGASADEPVVERLSVERATTYLDHGARAWYGARKCVSCHTNGTYLLVRPALTAQLGPPNDQVRN